MSKVSKIGSTNAPKRVEDAKNALSDAIQVIIELDKNNTEMADLLKNLHILASSKWPILMRRTLRKALAGGQS